MGNKYASILDGEEYNFIKTNEHLGKHVILLGLAGSYSYGTNNENSDIDVRGVALNRKSDLIGLTSYEQYVDENTDTVIYAFMQLIIRTCRMSLTWRGFRSSSCR